MQHDAVRAEAYSAQKLKKSCATQNASLRVFGAKHFTTLHAGLALTLISLPKAMRLPAGVAFLWRSLIMDTPGIVNLPCFFRASGTRVCKAAKTALHSFFFTPALASICANMSDWVMPRMAFMLFIAFTMARFGSVQEVFNGYEGKMR